jgi:hypothetical protein
MTLAQVKVYCEQDLADESRLLLYELLCGLTGKGGFNARSIGRHLMKHRDKVVGGLVLRQGEEGKHGTKWWVDEKSSGKQTDFDYSGYPSVGAQ